MTKDLLWRGMLAGVLAALLATVFARVYAEPQVDRAIAFESAHETHAMGHADDDADPPVSRATQKSIGSRDRWRCCMALPIGGLFSLVFAYCYGRVGRADPRTLAMLIAALGFLISRYRAGAQISAQSARGRPARHDPDADRRLFRDDRDIDRQPCS